MSNFDIYQMITNRIIEKLEKGEIAWRKPFASRVGVNWLTQKPYRGINTLLLDGGEYATFNQITKNGGKVKKGEKSQIAVFWKLIEKEKEDGTVEKIPMLRYYRVFEINTQCERLKSNRNNEVYDHNPIDEAEKVVKGYPDPPKFNHVSGRAYYRPSQDLVNVPDKSDFENIEEYYSVLFHELVHSTGHEKRLKREGVVNLKESSFGSETYSNEELIAEIGASMLNGVVGIENATLENSTAYIQGWLKRLKNDKKFIVKASQQAQKACDHILNIKHES